MIYQNIINDIAQNKKLLAVLIDPDSIPRGGIDNLLTAIDGSCADYIFVGGSLVSSKPDTLVEKIKMACKLPVIIFPGSLLQIAENADALLLLSLISGRNPEYLIGNHVVAAPYIKKTGLETISTSYILVGNGHTSAVEYMSNTKPIPADKPELITATAMAGEMLGHKMVYLESGSGTNMPLMPEIIMQVKQNIRIPLIVGGGLRSDDMISKAYQAGADIVVVGNALEEDLSLLGKIQKG
jgi:phosphoglycerol geranylgeranyltransferase